MNGTRFTKGEQFKVRIRRPYGASVSKGDIGTITKVHKNCPPGFCGKFGALMSNPSECPFYNPKEYHTLMNTKATWYFRDCDIVKLHDQNDIEWYKSPLS